EACLWGWGGGGDPGVAGGGGPRPRGPREACFAGWEVGGVPGAAGGGGVRSQPERSQVAVTHALPGQLPCNAGRAASLCFGDGGLPEQPVDLGCEVLRIAGLRVSQRI